jgi:predicted O-methyltransferase YrrM
LLPPRVRSVIRALLQLLEAKTPHNILEIGTARGGTLFLLSRVGAVDASLASVDLPGGKFGGGYGRIWVPLLKAMPSERQTLRLIRGDSHDLRTYEETRRWLGGEPLDCLLVDGDHHVEGVRGDFVLYGPLVRPVGVVAIHDIVPGREGRVGGVPKFLGTRQHDLRNTRAGGRLGAWWVRDRSRTTPGRNASTSSPSWSIH